ncbi:MULTISPECIES: TIGR03621 family F420-dependent LLM class oxidoreductase [unclassified Nocardia]|uniref:TIGR03621 family F420-dependent LLM class oxidoreductase n=1 Tax=unclassified Nocardia TaxID=2637762 RepID=UPI001CE3B6C3|nr:MULTISPECIES: TIGR03621 family F420-dependent LLM class oxidoreductase [unclassified Nocardia]
MTVRSFRFGVNMTVPESRARWIEKCRRAEELGYDVIGVADHLGMAPPFPAMILAAEATERVRLTTFVLNVPFYNPVLLARDAAGADLFTDGRIELGLGAGYVKAEFDAAGIAFESGRRRVEQLAETVVTLRKSFTGAGFQPHPVQPDGPPLLIAGWGERLLRLAAEHADIIGFTGAASAADGHGLRIAGPSEFDARVAYLRGLLGGRDVELNVLVQRVMSRDEQQELLRQHAALLLAELVEHPGESPIFLTGSPAEIAERVREHRERFGFSYITVLEDSMERFAPVIELLR